MTTLLVDGLSWLLLLGGGVFCVIGAVGMVRMPDFYTRMHAASVVDTLGAGGILLGLMLQAGPTLVAVKLGMVGLLLLLASPTATHALARAALLRGVQPLLAEPLPAPDQASPPAAPAGKDGAPSTP